MGKAVDLKDNRDFWVVYCENASKLVSPMDYHTRVIWSKINCHYYPFCLDTPLPQTCSCKLRDLKCEICHKALWDGIDPTSYGKEAIPGNNPNWLKHYKLACNSCHRKEHIKKPWLNNRKQWKEVFSAKSTLLLGQLVIQVPEFNCYVIKDHRRLDIVRLG